MEQIIKTLSWKKSFLEIMDQSRLPSQEKYIKLFTVNQVYQAIKTLKIRGAPAIGLAAAFGLLLATKQMKTKNKDKFFYLIQQKAEYLKGCRPTAYNLFYGIDRLIDVAKQHLHLSIEEIIMTMEKECLNMFYEDLQNSFKIAEYGEKLIKDGMRILTHCNAGALATSGIGTALAPIYLAAKRNKKVEVFVDETRPVLQGARLTMWELKKAKIKCTLVCDNMAGFLMQQKKIDIVITGADRIARNGDTANKIGTYSVAVLAKFHDIPFYIAAPLSTFDFSLPDGNAIPIEQRNKKEIEYIQGKRIAPLNINVYNPAFDVTPCNLITGVITEKGLFRADRIKNLTR
ncbi:MAG TPA: S-methyl-5-thioribose-1-phosphate isomerase [bacterium]|nr:S-methyl-5-thioribose-1-phosphate isomerase [bacterium]HOL49014.1 S-methyl-5-thioribose-1-phosphate isomerase [bacterium]HPO51282.1 S-methyl-5-thioribose-1-phosphate isomerase [bacterium]HXK44814.1 S-methyl-5-thioribose-1-phosphate isomerase [bacterium]